jgi:RNA polymerase sigma-70 factor (ECF subfamily)
VIPVPSLAELFVAHLRVGSEARAPDDALESELAGFLVAARSPWPALLLDAQVFLRHVAERSPDGSLPPPAHAADLYLACACAHSVPGAHKEFLAHHGEAIARVVSRTNASPSFVDEAKQRLLQHLFVSPRGAPPKIADYGGRAALRTWLTIAASRSALMLVRSNARRRETEGPSDVPALDASPELAHLKRRYAADFSAALATAFARLSDKERTLLQLHIVDRAGIDALGELYKVGRSTAARWLASARATLVEETRRELQRKLGLSRSDYESLAVLVRSQLDVSVVKLLQSP